MSLPKNDTPTYTLTLPSTGKSLTIRPFLVKEEKLLLLAKQSGDIEDIRSTITTVLENCVLSKDWKLSEASIFDVEFILINLRIRSLGDVLVQEYVCNTPIEDVPCNTPFSISIKLEDVLASVEKLPDDKLWLTPNVLGVKMRYPRFSVTSQLDMTSDFDFALLSEAVEAVFDAKGGYYALKDQDKDEVTAFFEGLTKVQFDAIVTWLKELPRYSARKEHVCSKCGTKHVIEVSDLSNLF